jgi:geranylgeranyl transferase type-1 subunit beta
VLQGVYENEPLVPGFSLQDVDFVGFNGRCNKSVDTCYAYWVTASLDVSPFIRGIQNECADQKQMLGQDRAQLLNIKAARRFLLDQTQHRIGGFGKAPGNPPGQYFYDDHLFQANFVARYLPLISGPCRTCHYERTWVKTF